MYLFHLSRRLCILFVFGANFNALLGYSTTTAPSSIHDVTSYGAVGDGVTIDIPSINRAIEAAAAAGGGTVFFPAGKYVSVTIHLKSNVSLDISAGATIVGAIASKEVTYNPPEPNLAKQFQDFGHNHWNNSLISGQNVENVFSDVRVNFEKDYFRPAFVLHNVEGADFHHIKAQHAADVPVFDLKDVKDFSLLQGAAAADVHREQVDREQF